LFAYNARILKLPETSNEAYASAVVKLTSLTDTDQSMVVKVVNQREWDALTRIKQALEDPSSKPVTAAQSQFYVKQLWKPADELVPEQKEVWPSASNDRYSPYTTIAGDGKFDDLNIVPFWSVDFWRPEESKGGSEESKEGSDSAPEETEELVGFALCACGHEQSDLLSVKQRDRVLQWMDFLRTKCELVQRDVRLPNLCIFKSGIQLIDYGEAAKPGDRLTLQSGAQYGNSMAKAVGKPKGTCHEWLLADDVFSLHALTQST
jgi:hypothetical protein